MSAPRIVATKWGKLFCRPNDQFVGASLCAYHEFSPGEQRLFSEVLRPGDTALDVGANVGAHTICMAKLVGPGGRVFAFEPQRLTCQMLAGSLVLNDVRNVMVVNAPVAAVPGLTVRIPDLDPDAVLNFGGLSLRQDEQNGIPLTTVTLDDLQLPSCRLIKADVEGMELAVLQGATHLIKRHAPVLYLEADYPGQGPRLVELLRGWGYRCYHHTPPLYRQDNPAGHRENIWHRDLVSINICALPASWTTDPPKGCKEVTP